MIRAMVAFQVETRTAICRFTPALFVAAAVFYALVEVVLQRGDFFSRQHVLHHQKTVPVKLFNLRLLDHVVALLSLER